MAHRLTNNGSDQDGLLPLLDAAARNTGEMPDEVSADNGFCSEANLEGLVARTVRGYVAAGRASKPSGGRRGGPMGQAMRARLRRGGYRSRDAGASVLASQRLSDSPDRRSPFRQREPPRSP